MEANITVMTVTNKIKNNFSSFLFDDEVIGWAAKENSKNRFKHKYDLWTIQSLSLIHISEPTRLLSKS